jgi:hypothetical protein
MPGDSADQADWIAYCSRDAEILERAVLALVGCLDRIDAGNMRWTAAGQSMASWRHGRMGCAVATGHPPHLKRMERAAYYGARQTCYYLGAVVPRGTDWVANQPGVPEGMPVQAIGPIHRLDLTSAYPSVMEGHRYPVGYLYRELDPSADTVSAVLANQACVAVVSLRSENYAYPIRLKGEPWHCAGDLTTVLAGPELAFAMGEGHLRKVHQIQVYEAGEPFSDWARWVTGWRATYKAEGRPLEERVVKLLANSLYGKLGQRGRGWRTVPGVCPAVRWGSWTEHNRITGEVSHWRSLGGTVQRLHDDEESEQSFPAISAYVTSYFRLMMSHLISVAGYREVLYEDADSVHVTDRGLAALDRAGLCAVGQVGALAKIDSAERCIYYGPKHYRFGDALTCPGIRSAATVDARGLWHQTEFTRLDAALAGGMPVGPVSSDVAKREGESHARRRMADGGWTSHCHLRSDHHDYLAANQRPAQDAGGVDRPLPGKC